MALLIESHSARLVPGEAQFPIRAEQEPISALARLDELQNTFAHNLPGPDSSKAALGSIELKSSPMVGMSVRPLVACAAGQRLSKQSLVRRWQPT